MKSKKAVTVFVLIIAAVWAVVNIVLGIKGLANTQTAALSKNSPKGSVCEFNIIFATEIYEIDHKLNGLIPLGSEHFYLAVTDNEKTAPMLIKASPKWYEKNFTGNGTAPNGVHIKGEVSGFKSESRSKLSEINRKLSAIDATAAVSETLYINTSYLKRHAAQLGEGVFAVAFGVLIALLLGKPDMPQGAQRALLVFLIITGIGLLWLGLAMIAGV